MDINDFLETARIAGYFDISQIKYALMEANGKVSFLPMEDYNYLTDLCRQLKVEDLVTFEGRWEQQKIYSLLANYDLFIQPSRNEGFGLTIAEAMAAKVPVLVSDIPAPMEVIDDGRLGLSFENENPADCAEKLLFFIRKGRNKEQVEDAYQYVKSHYDVSVTARKYIEVYKSILKE